MRGYGIHNFDVLGQRTTENVALRGISKGTALAHYTILP
jgi:hypothetical protein